MRNLTVNIPGETCRRARIGAAQHDTSVSAIVNCLLETLPSLKRAFHALPVSTANPAGSFDKFASN